VLVCPSCRSENDEESSVCRVCGRSLAPGEAPLRRADAAEPPEDELDVPAPKPPSRWPAIAALATQFAQGIRNTQEAFGVTLGPVQTIEVGDGTQAFAWQAAVQQDDGSIVQQRMVALVRDGVGWRITLGGDGDSFDEARFALEEILATWDWNDAA
jgi:hypothetical protein